jgi:hypothetical protein
MMKSPKALGKFLVITMVAASAAVAIGLGRPQDEQTEQLPSIIRSSSSLGDVAFPHQFHFEVLEFECQTCHHETNATALHMPHEDYFKDFWIDCTICHRKDGSAASQPQSCSNCHHNSPTDIADETLSSKVVIHKKCWECHELGVGREASQGCSECHIQDSDKNMAPEMPSIAAMKGQG